MIDRNNPNLKEALKRKSERGINGAIEAMNAISLIEITTHGKRNIIHVNGKTRTEHYKKYAKKYLTEWKGKMYPMTSITITNVIHDIMKALDFSFETFDKYYPNVEIRKVTKPVKSKQADPKNKEKKILRKSIRDNIWLLSENDLTEVLSLIIRRKEKKLD